MPKRTKADDSKVLSVYESIGRNGRATARQLGLHENTVYQVLKRNRGDCVKCGKPVNPGEKNCPDCKKINRDRMKDRRAKQKRLGLCVECDEPQVANSRLYCAKHRIAHLEAGERARKRKKRGAPNNGIPVKKDRERNLRTKYGDGGVIAWHRHDGCCSMCHVSYTEKAIHIHHIDVDDTNHDPSNLTTLCFRCHRLVHLLIEYPDLSDALSWLRSTYPNLPW